MNPMTDETIQQDVSDAGQKGQAAETTSSTAEGQAEHRAPLTDPVSVRERKMADLAQKRIEERERERKAAALMNDPDLSEDEYDARIKAAAAPDEDEDDEADPKPEPAAQKPKATEPDARGWRTRDDGVRIKTLKVNGQTVEMTEDEYDRQLQKEIAGDQKLRLAAEREQQLARREQEIARRMQEVSQPPKGAAQDVERALSEYHDALLDGDTDAAKAKLLDVINAGRQSSTPNIDDIVSQVATRVEHTQAAKRHKESVEEGWSTFKRDYSDIVADEGLLAYADTQVKRLRQEKPELSPAQVILEAGRITREKLGLGKVPAPPSADRADRMERKANLKPIQRASGARAPSAEKPKVDMSPAAKIARLRAGRAV
jgi:hypothetical protein